MVALLAGCDGGDRGPFENAEAVIEAMKENGIECEDIETTSEFGSESDAIVSERAFCFVDEDTSWYPRSTTPRNATGEWSPDRSPARWRWGTTG